MFPSFERARLSAAPQPKKSTAALAAAVALLILAPFMLAQKPAPANVTADLPAGHVHAGSETRSGERYRGSPCRSDAGEGHHGVSGMSRSAHHPAAASQQGCVDERSRQDDEMGSSGRSHRSRRSHRLSEHKLQSGPAGV